MSSFVNVPVPKDLVEDVYALVASRRRLIPESDVGPRPLNGDGGADSTDPVLPTSTSWDESRIQELLRASTSSTAKIIRRVASDPQAGLPTTVLTDAAGLKGGRGMGGWVARVRKLCTSRWGLPLPIEGEWDEELGHHRWTMDPELARVVRQIDID